MTIGDRIRYFRTKRGITQGALAELSGIHPVSIRKYETNKTQPQPPQIEKIAAALCVNYTAISGTTENYLRLDTVGDFMGLLMLLYDAGIIQVKGNRAPNGAVDRDACELKFTPVLSNFLGFLSKDTSHALENVMIHIKDPKIYNDFLNWDKTCYCYTRAVLTASEKDIPVLEDMLMYKNAIELEMQSSTKPLDETTNKEQ